MHKCVQPTAQTSHRTVSWNPPPHSLRETSIPKPLQDRLNAPKLQSRHPYAASTKQTPSGSGPCRMCRVMLRFLPSACG